MTATSTPDPAATPATVMAAVLAAWRELDERCCDPGRSPRMAALGDRLETVRAAVAGDPADRPAAVTATLEEAGGMIGALQVGCCAPDRLPLYARMLAGLTTVQLELGRADPPAG